MISIRAQLRILVDLQDIDARIQQMRDAKEQIPRELDSIRAEQAAHEQRVAETQQRQAKIETDQRSIEHEIQLEKEQIKRYEERVTQIKTNKEYQALLKEISVAKKMKEDSEEELLKTMILMDENRRVLSQSESEKRALDAQFAEKEKALLARLKEVEETIQGVVTERDRTAVGVSADLLRRYDLIRQRRGGVALARAKTEICMACHRNIPPQIFNELLKDEVIHTCPSCNRILYFEPGDEVAEAGTATA
ncbi:MAG: hypothetical protein HYY13_09515 [Nitrospirae bacterium]|nr:hypothetical protein [Nitrospirota bacterium]